MSLGTPRRGRLGKADANGVLDMVSLCLRYASRQLGEQVAARKILLIAMM